MRAAVVLVALGLVACGSGSPAPPPAPAPALVIYDAMSNGNPYLVGGGVLLGWPGAQHQLFVQMLGGLPGSAPPVWSIVDPSVATVDANGLVTAVADGLTTLSVSLGGLTATTDVRTLIMIGPADTLVISPTHPFVIADQLIVQAIYYDGSGHGSFADHPIWHVADESIATINEAGHITPFAQGSTPFKAEYLGITAGDVLTVHTAKSVLISGAPPLGVSVGDVVQLSAVVIDVKNQPMPPGSMKITWASSAPSVATVDASGLVQGTGNGTTVISASSSLGQLFGELVSEVQIRVGEIVSKVTVSPESVTVPRGARVQFAASVHDATGHDIADTTITWHSSDARFVDIDASTGLATAVAAGGPVTIQATVSGPNVLSTPAGIASISVQP